jgi:formate-dependent phosphoribosylglycinamide formyltransferase (GAR transformylase)
MVAFMLSSQDNKTNRFLQKKFVNGCGIPTTDFRLARNHRELVLAHQALGFPGVLKLQFDDRFFGSVLLKSMPSSPSLPSARRTARSTPIRG